MPIISKPTWLASALTWLNFNRGEWLNAWPLVIPPFSFTPGHYIEVAIDLLIWPINEAYDFAVLGWNSAWDALTKATSALFKIESWLLGAIQWFTNQVTDWWLTIIPGLGDLLSWMVAPIWEKLTALWDWFTGIDDWFKDKVAPVFAWIGVILVNYVSKVDLADLFKPVQAVVDFWWDRGEDLVDFFTDPWDFLYKKFDDFFERFW